jgi:GNAT superfamily N-acetyltransferase
MRVDVTTYYLEMTHPNDLRPKGVHYPGLDIRQVHVPLPEFNRFLYTAVGGDWYWTERLPWTYQQWCDWLERPEVQTWVAYVSGAPAGYFELEAQADGQVEIAYFGLLPQFIGIGLGGHLLTVTIERAWAMGAARVWVHTCTLDHPDALANYRARGLRVFREETHTQDVPESSPGPWPGAQRQPGQRAMPGHHP